MELTSTISLGMIINWVIIIGVGGMVIGLVKYSYKRDLSILLSKEEHSRICPVVISEIVRRGKEDAMDSMIKHKEWLQAKFDAIDEKIENTVMKELRKLNNK